MGDVGSGKVVAVRQNGLGVQLAKAGKMVNIKVDDIKGKYVTPDEEKEGLTKFTKIIKELKKQIESSTIKDAHDQGYGETQSELVRFKQDLYKATWYGTAAWRKNEGEWNDLKATLNADDKFKCKAVLMSQKEENDAIHVHENVLPEFYRKYLSLFLGNNKNKEVIRYAKFIAGGNSSVQVCIKPMLLWQPLAALKEQNAMLRSELEKKSKKGRAKAKRSVTVNTEYEMLKDSIPIETLATERKIKQGTKVICDENINGILKGEVGTVFIIRSGKIQVRWTGRGKNGVTLVDGKQKIEVSFPRPSDPAKCKVSGYTKAARRRMAQREFSNRRDSPVMV